MPALIVGVTGKIGSGKSTACKILKEQLSKLGLTSAIMDCDSLFKQRVSKDPLYLKSSKVANGWDDKKPLKIEDVIRLMNRMTIRRYSQFIHNINFHMYPVIVDWINNTHADVIIIESALLLDTPLAFQCDNILEIVVSRAVREERALLRDKGIRPTESTIELLNFQEKYLKFQYRSTINMNKTKVIRQYTVRDNKDTEYVELYTFLAEYSKKLNQKIIKDQL